MSRLKVWAPTAAAVVVCGGLGAVVGSQLAVAEKAAQEMSVSSPTLVSKNGAEVDNVTVSVRPDYPVNDRGQTYGVAAEVTEHDPDLIRAQASNGRVGYVLAADLEPPDFDSPEAAYAWMEKQSRRGEQESVPVYAVDGVTVIGELFEGRSETTISRSP